MDDIGISLSDVFNLLLNQIRIRGEIPFTLTSNYYSPELIKSIKDSEKEIATAKKYDDVEEMQFKNNLVQIIKIKCSKLLK
ncbi:MAG: type II toxin-antitoxin system RelB/DinJ family antitoxin [Firmicutes bacterium]|nr:type II toxin-antitoxin system RelB/DinJ family antitoxin [Bacillota bacterium]